MRARLPWLLLALSLIVNLFFLGGYLWAEHRRPAERQVAAAIAERLDLTREERESLSTLSRTLAARAEERRQAGGEARTRRYREMLELIAAERYDPEALATLLSARRQEQTAFWIDAGQELHGFLRSLPPDKRERFIALASEDRRLLGRLLFGWGRSGESRRSD